MLPLAANVRPGEPGANLRPHLRRGQPERARAYLKAYRCCGISRDPAQRVRAFLARTRPCQCVPVGHDATARSSSAFSSTARRNAAPAPEAAAPKVAHMSPSQAGSRPSGYSPCPLSRRGAAHSLRGQPEQTRQPAPLGQEPAPMPQDPATLPRIALPFEHRFQPRQTDRG
jgi:hypothetical protein